MADGGGIAHFHQDEVGVGGQTFQAQRRKPVSEQALGAANLRFARADVSVVREGVYARRLRQCVHAPAVLPPRYALYNCGRRKHIAEPQRGERVVFGHGAQQRHVARI